MLVDAEQSFTEPKGTAGRYQSLAGLTGEVASLNAITLNGGPQGTRLYAVVAEPFAGPVGTTLSFRIEGEALPRFGPLDHGAPFVPAMVLWQSGSFGLAGLGPETVMADVPLRSAVVGRLRLVFTISGGPFTAGAIDAGIGFGALSASAGPLLGRDWHRGL